ncbi:MAG: hypothetical protein II847_06535, partial [Ruminobacter sp.]|uniref:hypothetical protein n=1 Tax=Ruminobacter sp. TaxID=2774296 RepID=UPI002579F56E
FGDYNYIIKHTANPYFSRLFNDFIICPNSIFFIEKNFIQKSIHVFKNTRTAKDMGYVAIFTLKQVGNSSYRTCV